MPSLADDLMLLLLDDRYGKATVNHSQLDLALAGAVILDLINAGRVAEAGAGEEGADEGDVVVRDASPTGDAVLDKALTRLSRKPRGMRAAIDLVEDGIRDAILDRLVQRGLLRRDEGTLLGLFKTESWPAADAAYEAQLRQSIEGALLRGERLDDHVASLVALLWAVGELDDTLGVEKSTLVERVQQVVPEGSLNDRVRDAVKDAFVVNAAEAGVVAAAATVTVAAAGVGIAQLLRERAEDRAAQQPAESQASQA